MQIIHPDPLEMAMPLPSDEFPPAVEASLATLLEAGLTLGQARVQEMTLADMRALVKGAGIKRLMDAGKYTSVTAAEKNIEEDEEFRCHRRAESDAVLARTIAETEWEVARFRAKLAVDRAN